MPCLYHPAGYIQEVIPIGNHLRGSQVHQAIGGPYNTFEFGDNIVAYKVGSVDEINMVMTGLVDSPIYGPVLIGHRSWFTGGA